MNKTINFAHAVRPMTLERVHFLDGMILTAEDLEAERLYHLNRSRIINRAVFGCGIACGLEVKRLPDEPKSRFVCVHPGIAFDCHGDPLELCRAVKLDLDPDPCTPPPERVCILIRRRDGAPQSDDACGCGTGPENGSRRVREEVELRVIDPGITGSQDICGELPSRTASHDAGDYWGREHEEMPEQDECDCLKACDCYEQCCEGWILLACVDLKKWDRTDDYSGADRDRWVVDGDPDPSGRKYIKPIHCACPKEEADGTGEEYEGGDKEPAGEAEPPYGEEKEPVVESEDEKPGVKAAEQAPEDKKEAPAVTAAEQAAEEKKPAAKPRRTRRPAKKSDADK